MISSFSFASKPYLTVSIHHVVKCVDSRGGEEYPSLSYLVNKNGLQRDCNPKASLSTKGCVRTSRNLSTLYKLLSTLSMSVRPCAISKRKEVFLQ